MVLKDADEYASVYSRLDSSDLTLEEDAEGLSMETSKLRFTSEKYDILLNADFEADKYELIVKDINE